MSGFGARLRRLRQERGLSQKELGDALGVRNTTVSQWESEINEPSREMVAKLAQFFGVTTDYLLLGRTDRRNGDKPSRQFDLPSDLVDAINSLPEEARRVFLRAKNLSPEGLRSVVDYINFKLEEEGKRV